MFLIPIDSDNGDETLLEIYILDIITFFSKKRHDVAIRLP